MRRSPTPRLEEVSNATALKWVQGTERGRYPANRHRCLWRWPPSLATDGELAVHHPNITLFLTCYDKLRNFTISNSAAPGNHTNAYAGHVLDWEPSSKVKHINWHWPACFVGQGRSDSRSARADYNIPMHQTFRWSKTEYCTLLSLPISRVQWNR